MSPSVLTVGSRRTPAQRLLTLLLALLALVAALLAAACSPMAVPLPALEGSEPAPDLQLPTPTGEILQLADFRGKVVFVNFWGTYCPPCVDELPDLQALQDEFAGDTFTVLGVNVEERPEVVMAWVAEHDLTFPNVISDDGTINPTLALHRMPTTWFVDADGILRGKIEGQMSRTTARRILRLLLPQP